MTVRSVSRGVLEISIHNQDANHDGMSQTVVDPDGLSGIWRGEASR